MFLLELSDTNSVCLKNFRIKHRVPFITLLQVANLAEAAAVAIDANVLLTRVGALYHDIGKMNNAYFFHENQRGSVSPHDDLSPKKVPELLLIMLLMG